MTKSTIIIPVFNQAALTRQCLETILGREDCRIIVVNDASTDGTANLLADFGDRIKVITRETNCGFARSCNDGAAAARTEHLVFLNNDTIPQPGWLERLEHYADKNPRAAVVGSKLLYPVNTIQHAGVVICQDRYPRHIYTGFPANHPAVNKSRRFQIVTAACMLVRREIFAAADGFDTRFRNGFEDVDFCLRLGERGYEIHYCADSVVQHLESVSPGRFKSDKDNVALYRERWLARVQPDDFGYYLEDGLLKVSYEGTFPIHLDVSPELAALNGEARKNELEKLLADRARQVADLTREVSKVRALLGQSNPASPAVNADRERDQIRAWVRLVTPPDARILIVSKGDSALLELDDRHAAHFPQTDSGVYLGYHPADSAEAIAHLEALQARGAEYLVIPRPSLWWLEYYPQFRQHLDTRARVIARATDSCVVYDLRAAQLQIDLPIALLVGCARSGTSILGEAIAAHPAVKYIFEPHDVWEQAGLGENGSHRLTATDATPAVSQRIRSWFAAQQGTARLVVDKTPRNALRVPFVRVVFPEAKIIHIVRDGRDVACSLLPGAGGNEWKHLKPPSWQTLQAQFTGLERCARVWQEVVDLASFDLAAVPHLTVHYEQLVADPQTVMAQVLVYLGLSPDPAVDTFCRRVQNETSGSYHAQRQHEYFRDNHAVRVGRWRENATPTEQARLNELLEPTLQRLGYLKAPV